MASMSKHLKFTLSAASNTFLLRRYSRYGDRLTRSSCHTLTSVLNSSRWLTRRGMHGQRKNPTHLTKMQHDLQGYLRILASIETKRVEAHVKDLESLGMRPQMLLLLRPAILHLVEQEWIKRIELVSFLKKQGVKKETLELFFCASLRFQSVQGIKKGIVDFVGAVRHDFPLVCERVGSKLGQDLNVSRLVNDPWLFL
jgi:hypothetical protein